MDSLDYRVNIKINQVFRGGETIVEEVKYEDIYLRAYDSASAVRTGLNRYFNFYNSRRPHSSLDGQTPDHVYFNSLPQTKAA